MRITGLSAAAGSWNTSPIEAPRTERMSRSPSVIRSVPSNTMRPPVIFPGSTSRSIASAIVLFPQPDSPTSA